MSPNIDASRPHANDRATLTQSEQHMLRLAHARRALRAARAAEARWIQDALGRSRSNEMKLGLARDALRADAHRHPDADRNQDGLRSAAAL